MLVRRGMGAVLDSSGCWTMPDYCTWMPFSSLTSACQAPSAAQLNSPSCNAGPQLNVNANTPAVPASTIACQSDPQGCTEFNVAANSPLVAATVGTGVIGQVLDAATGGGDNGAGDGGNNCGQWYSFLNSNCPGAQIPLAVEIIGAALIGLLIYGAVRR